VVVRSPQIFFLKKDKNFLENKRNLIARKHATLGMAARHIQSQASREAMATIISQKK
jgi:hypothetical protein